MDKKLIKKEQGENIYREMPEIRKDKIKEEKNVMQSEKTSQMEENQILLTII